LPFARSLVSADVANYPADDSFKASKKICELILPGVAAIFGPVSATSSNHVQVRLDEPITYLSNMKRGFWLIFCVWNTLCRKSFGRFFFYIMNYFRRYNEGFQYTE
jgi:hypothetical protein